MPGKIFAFHKRVGTVNIIVATDNDLTTTGGWRTDSGTSRDATDGIIEINESQWGALVIPSAWDAANITFVSAPTRGGTYTPVYDESGTLVTMTVGGTSRTIFIPAKVFGCGPYIKLVTTAPQTGNRAIGFVLGT